MNWSDFSNLHSDWHWFVFKTRLPSQNQAHVCIITNRPDMLSDGSEICYCYITSQVDKVERKYNQEVWNGSSREKIDPNGYFKILGKDLQAYYDPEDLKEESIVGCGDSDIHSLTVKEFREQYFLRNEVRLFNSPNDFIVQRIRQDIQMAVQGSQTYTLRKTRHILGQ